MFLNKSAFALKLALSAVASLVTFIAFASMSAAAVPVTNWQETGVKSFHELEAFSKSQGIASDGERIFFSWNVGLHSTDLSMDNLLVDNIFDAIPQDMRDKGSDHIGDLDYYDGQLYGPIEDGAHLYPTIVMFDPDTLQPTGQRFPLNTTLLTDGVPWVAIDAARQVAYTSKWNNTGTLNVHRLSDFAITSTVQLSRPVPRIQGAKVYRGILYAARDNAAEKTIEAIDPATGEVTSLFDRNLGEDHEAEGIAFVTNEGGTTMMTSDIDESDGNRVDVHSYRVAGDVTPPVLSAMKATSARVKKGAKVGFSLSSSEAVTTSAAWLKCIGPKSKPCAKTAPAGKPALTSLVAGNNALSLPPRGQAWAPGRKFNPGRFRLSITPTDQADAIGNTASAGFAVLKPKKTKPAH